MNLHGKTIDKTFLSIDNAEDRGFIHRDYIAHCLRWTHVVKRLYERKMYETARILDVGCGREIPLAKTLYSSKLIPTIYLGVDAGPILDEEVAKIAKTQKFPHKLWENTNFLELERQDVGTMISGDLDNDPENWQLPNIVTSFEVLEHVEPKMMFDILEHMKLLSSDDCRFFISTPCWNRTDCAGNHVNEMLYEALGAGFERHGFVVENVYGTFASIRDYEHLMCTWSPDDLGPNNLAPVFRALREYYDTNFLSCVFAPLFPAQSRNCLWELSKAGRGDKRATFPLITDIQQPWSSSTKWEDMKL